MNDTVVEPLNRLNGASIVVHVVLSTKGRRWLVREELRGQLRSYITGILKNHHPAPGAKFGLQAEVDALKRLQSDKRSLMARDHSR